MSYQKLTITTPTGQTETNIHAIPLLIQRNSRARRISLRYNPVDRQLALTLPKSVSVNEGMDFFNHKKDWLAETLKSLPKHVPFKPGAIIPVMGKKYRIRYEAELSGRSMVKAEDDILYVTGPKDQIARHVQDWIKKQVRKKITTIAESKAELIGRKVRRITLRDTRSRWGSCSSQGRLSFSWRLAFAPPSVLHYIVCHEVAHMREMNHGPAFWRLVARICPSWASNDQWLKDNSHVLYRYGK